MTVCRAWTLRWPRDLRLADRKRPLIRRFPARAATALTQAGGMSMATDSTFTGSPPHRVSCAEVMGPDFIWNRENNHPVRRACPSKP